MNELEQHTISIDSLCTKRCSELEVNYQRRNEEVRETFALIHSMLREASKVNITVAPAQVTTPHRSTT